MILAAADAIVEIGLSRSPGFGGGGTYAATFRRQEQAELAGLYFANQVGVYESELEPGWFGDLARAVVSLGFAQLAADYTSPVSCATNTDIWVVSGHERRTVREYASSGPEQLRIIQRLLDDLVAALDWHVTDRVLPAGLFGFSY